MKVGVTGAAGLLGHALVEVFARHHTVVPLTRTYLDITDAERVHAVLREVGPQVVIHSAAIPDLDICEAEPAKAFQVNYHGTRNIVEAARRVGTAVAYISTDAVFDGRKQAPYTETDPPNPPTVYGRTKLRGEQVVRTLPTHWVFRVSVLFGPGKTNFVEKGLGRIAAGEDYVVAADQLGSATYTLDAAWTIMEVIEAGRGGLYHLSNQGTCTRLELARRAAELAGLPPEKVIGKPSDEMARRAARLKYAVMEMAALKSAGFRLLRAWPEALAEYVATLIPSLRPAPSARPLQEVRREFPS